MKAHWIAGLFAAVLAAASTAQELSEDARAQIAERISFMGSVCLKGEDCGGNNAAMAGSAGAAAPATSASPASGAAPASDTAPAVAAAGGAATDGSGEKTVADASSAAGEAIYNKACVACHAAGVAGAPVVGDAAAWADRIAKGMDALYSSGINGLAGGAMMAKGGCMACTDDEIRAAVDFMVAQSQ
jgi:cytochrome c5